MKVLVLNYEYPPLGGGGGRLCRVVAEGLVARGHLVRVVTAGMSHLPRSRDEAGVQVLRPWCLRKAEDECRVHEMAAYLVQAAPQVIRQVSLWRPDVMHAHFVVPTGLLALAASMAFRVPLVVTAHLGDVPGGVPEQTGRIFRVVAPWARMVWRCAVRRTAVSRYVAGLAERAFGRPAVVIPNGCRAPEYVPDFGCDGVPRILFVGRLSVQKNPVLALEALGLVKDLRWHFDVVGDGPLGEELRMAIRRLELEGRCQMHGWLDGGRVRELMRRAQILLISSRNEGLPMAAIEGLWHGLAIVGTRIEGLADVARPGWNGELCEQSPGGLATGLRKLLMSAERLRQAREASYSLAKEFALEKSVGAYESVLAEACRGGGS